VVVEPGEMVLVLGRPGSGCTSFLKTVSRQLDSNCRVAGNFRLLRSGSDKDHNLKNEQTLFCAANDVHMPTLTVKQTLQFALASKLPHQDAKSQTYVLDSLLNIFNLSHQADTLIGDALLRGVSGGERKRVSIAEALLSRPSVACWDNSTLGLDAGSASDFVKCLRMLTDIYHMTTFAALYQASDTLYELFDKVLVLEDGHQAYFGPSSAAKAYFEQQGFPHSPGQPLSDYLIDCVDSRNRSLEHSLRPDEVANIYRDSACYKAVIDQQERTIANAAQHAISTGATLQGPKPSLSYYNQILLTAKRHALLRLQDKLGLAVKGITAIVVSIIVGTMYWQLPRTSAGAFTRGGVIFITLLYNAFTAFVELPSAIFGRPVLRKHTALGFHRPSAMYLGQFCIDVPFAAVEVSFPAFT
jgi:ATP-binding cassette subfamily G (WHITE) protein 2 (SNQ2)